MLELSNKNLNSKDIESALDKVENYRGFSLTTSWRLARFVEKSRKEIVKTREKFWELLKKHCTLNEKQEPVHVGRDSNGQVIWQYKTPEAEKEFDREFEEFMATPFTVKAHKIKLGELEKVGLSPGELMALEVIIDVDEDDPNLGVEAKPEKSPLVFPPGVAPGLVRQLDNVKAFPTIATPPAKNERHYSYQW